MSHRANVEAASNEGFEIRVVKDNGGNGINKARPWAGDRPKHSGDEKHTQNGREEATGAPEVKSQESDSAVEVHVIQENAGDQKSTEDEKEVHPNAAPEIIDAEMCSQDGKRYQVQLTFGDQLIRLRIAANASQE